MYRLDRYSGALILLSIIVGICGVNIALESRTHYELNLHFSDYRFFLSWQAITLLSLLDIGLAGFFMLLVREEMPLN